MVVIQIWIVCLLFGTVICLNSYLITTPKYLRPGINLNIGIQILNAPNDVHILAELVEFPSDATISSITGTLKPGSTKTLTISTPVSLQHGAYILRFTGTGGISFRNETSITYVAKSVSLFIQTDKAVYNAGQTVHFRALAMYPNLTVYNGPMDVEIHDPDQNKIKQWLNVKAEYGVIENSMVMDTQPVMGEWKITVKSHGLTEQKSFKVKQYVLPKFSVSLDMPSFITKNDLNIHGTVQANYTYGKPVEGNTTIRARWLYWYKPLNYQGSEPILELQNIQLDRNGIATFTIPTDKLKNAIQFDSVTKRTIVISANVTEGLTRITLSNSKQIEMYAHAEKIEFVTSAENDSIFARHDVLKPGLPFTAYVRVSRQDNTPITERNLFVTIETVMSVEVKDIRPVNYNFPRIPPGATVNQNLTDMRLLVQGSGIVPIQLRIPENATQISITAKFKSLTAYKTVPKTYSPSGSYISISSQATAIQAGKVARFDILSTKPMATITYQIWSRETLTQTNILHGARQKTIQLHINVTSEMAPLARLVVYYVRSDGELVMDVVIFKVEEIFKNKVTLSFDKPKAKPGELITLTVNADPGSLVNVLAVDESVRLLQTGNDITISNVNDAIQIYDPVSRYDLKGQDTQELITNSGVQLITDALVCKKPWYILGVTLSPFLTPGPGYTYPPGRVQETFHFEVMMKKVDRIRSVFPETWLWFNKSTGADGQATMTTTLPDTLTTWTASAFAVNKVTGLGIANFAQIVGFKPFFVGLNLPYSVVRGEEVAIQVNVFNYLQIQTSVLVEFRSKPGFKNIVRGNNGNTTLVSEIQTDSKVVNPGSGVAMFFPIVPDTMGLITIEVVAQSTIAADGLRQYLLVEPEGVPREYTTPVLIGLNQGQSLQKNVPVEFPPSHVTGSERVTVSVIGDLMGPTMNNLDKLLALPTGCGEQTMLRLAPDVFVANYLNLTGQFTNENRKKTIDYIERGIQHELKYKHRDGSFSAWGDSDPSGSMWLTAFVVKTFHQARKIVYVDDKILDEAINWIILRQNPDGSFREPGRIIHKDMQGGSSTGQALTAFVLIALKENSDLQGEIQQKIQQASEKARSYLEHQILGVNDQYVLSIVSYALMLTGSSSTDSVFARLNKNVITKGETKHWERSVTMFTASWSPPHQQASPIDIEITSYALLVYKHYNLIGDGMSVLKWLMTQRNAYGGFASTQDTVLALQALSEFTELLHTQKPNIHVSFSNGSYSSPFFVNAQNSLVQQGAEIIPIPHNLTITATGSGLAIAEVSVFYNVMNESDDQAFDVKVSITHDSLDLIELQACSRLRHSGKTGMAIKEIFIPSGFEADRDSISIPSELRSYEVEYRKVIFYFEEISTSQVCITMKATRTNIVAKTQPCAVHVYDYYEPSKQGTTFYQPKRLGGSTICDVCQKCRICGG